MILLNTDFVIAYFDVKHTYHNRAIKLIRNNTESDFAISNLVKQELATVSCLRFGYTEAKKTIKSVDFFDPKNIFIRGDDTKRVWDLYFKQSTRMSFIDASNIYLSKKLNLKIASFDKVYPNSILVS